MKEQDAYQLIDSYLHDELNAEDKLAVESRLQTDPEFAETFSILKKVHGKTEDKGAMDLILRMKDLSEKYPATAVDLTETPDAPTTSSSTSTTQETASAPTPPSSGGLWKILLPIAILGGALLFYFMSQSGDENKIEVPKVEMPEETTKETTPVIETPVEKTIKETPPVKEEKEPQKVEQRKEEKPKPKLYAAADFETNAMLEKMIGTTTRSELSFKVTAPNLSQNFAESTTNVTFSGTTNSTDSQTGTFRLLDNNRVDISQQDISATDKFNFSAKVPKPGL